MAFVFLSLGACHVFAQAQTTGDVLGVVKDPSGASVGGAKVTLKNLQRGLSQDAKTMQDGIYHFPLLERATTR